MTLVRAEVTDTDDGIRVAGAAGSAFLDYYHRALADPAVPSRALELCTARYAQLLGTDVAAPSPGSAELSADDHACLQFGEQFLLDPQQIDDATADDVRTRLGDQGFVAFVLALGLVEQYQRAAILLHA